MQNFAVTWSKIVWYISVLRIYTWGNFARKSQVIVGKMSHYLPCSQKVKRLKDLLVIPTLIFCEYDIYQLFKVSNTSSKTFWRIKIHPDDFTFYSHSETLIFIRVPFDFFRHQHEDKNFPLILNLSSKFSCIFLKHFTQHAAASKFLIFLFQTISSSKKPLNPHIPSPTPPLFIANFIFLQVPYQDNDKNLIFSSALFILLLLYIFSTFWMNAIPSLFQLVMFDHFLQPLEVF